ncbi:protein disulfide oxidoreductase [Microbulbifer sp. OS29]|uniref:Protein disulfide oxidoreductase n=1 Tax=Microbulbifer okhotskensis TaxID=2926617 RepID=A0A9X2J688_9GAMM|nr:protein disulfide oxidoreductase [Microbulbifer okhotskensis]MCO1335174.1 protein disulfide oxidoreductase [Microbulbifer okhotskensis]
MEATIYNRISKLLVFILLAILMATAVGYIHQRDIPKNQAPPLDGYSLQGEVLNLNEMYTGGPVLIYFWASWCPYCRIVSPAVTELARDYQVIGVAMQSGDDEVVKEYMQRHALEFPVVNDPQGTLSTLWGIKVTPTLVIVGSDGNIAWITSGATSKLGLSMRLKLTK